jgi:ubiquinone/menaquinone biosynthesis C-methylase UbiE
LYAQQTARRKGIYEPLVIDRKQSLFNELAGTVLEIGPGIGTNLYLYPPSICWIGVEPNPYMHHYIRATAEQLGLTIDLRLGTAEQIDLADASVDAAVSTLVLCSVSDPVQSVREVLRVLKPGGRFIFVEHVAAPKGSGHRLFQRLFRPIWVSLAGNCHPDRETWTLIEQAGFAEVQIDHFPLPVGLTSPHIAGYAKKR